MNNQFDAKKIPKFLYLLFGTIVALVVFSIFVLTPLIQNAGAMQKKHEDTQQLIRQYDQALSIKDTIEKEIKKNQEEFKLKEEELFVNLDKSSILLEEYFTKNNIRLKSYTLAEPQPDSMGRVSSGGYPVNTVSISLAYSDSYEKTMSLLKFLENPENGCFYINSCNLSQTGDSGKEVFDTTIALQLYYYDRTLDDTQAK